MDIKENSSLPSEQMEYYKQISVEVPKIVRKFGNALCVTCCIGGIFAQNALVFAIGLLALALSHEIASHLYVALRPKRKADEFDPYYYED